MKRFQFFLICVGFLLIFNSIQAEGKTKVLIRCDDTGMCHSANMAVKRLIHAGIPFSTSVMFTCPWIQEAVDILKAHPDVGVGIHLTLNAEWKHYKWGPILGQSAVPTLVDVNGYFFKSEADFAARKPKLAEVEKELRAQIERALNTGLRIDYIDNHMGTASSTPELRALMEKLAKEYGLGISRYFSEVAKTIWAVEPKDKLSKLLDILKKLEPDKINLIVIHLGLENPEMDALIDMNNPDDPFRVSKHRQAELRALLSKKFLKAVKKYNIELITYRDIVKEMGLALQKRPVATEYNN